MTLEDRQKLKDGRARLAEIEAQVRQLNHEQIKIWKEIRPLERLVSQANSKARAASKEAAEKASRDKWSTHLRVGDIVRVRGTKDTRNPYRLVLRINNGTFDGEKVTIRQNSLTEELIWRGTGIYSTNGIEKIAEWIDNVRPQEGEPGTV